MGLCISFKLKCSKCGECYIKDRRDCLFHKYNTGGFYCKQCSSYIYSDELCFHNNTDEL